MDLDFLINSLKVNGSGYLIGVDTNNEEKAVEILQNVSKVLKKDLWYKKGDCRNDLFDVYTPRELRECYNSIVAEWKGFYTNIEPFDEWKNKYFKLVKR